MLQVVKSALRNSQSIDPLISMTRELIKQKEYALAVKRAKLVIHRSRGRHEGWRLLIEAYAKSPSQKMNAVRTYVSADLDGQLDDRARVKQALNILKNAFPKLAPIKPLQKNSQSGLLLSAIADKVTSGSALDALISVITSADNLQGKDTLAAGSSFAHKFGVKGKGLQAAFAPLVELAFGKKNFNSLPSGLARQFLVGYLNSIKKDELKAAGEMAVFFVQSMSASANIKPIMKRSRLGRLNLEGVRAAGAVRRRTTGAVAPIIIPLKQRVVSLRDRFSSRPELVQTLKSNIPTPVKTAIKEVHNSAKSTVEKSHSKDTGQSTPKLKESSTNDVSNALSALIKKPQNDDVFNQALAEANRISDVALASERLEQVALILNQKKLDPKKLYRVALATASKRKEGRHLRTPTRLQVNDFLDAALKSNPKDAALWCERVYIHLSRTEFELADALIEKFENAIPDSPEIGVVKSMSMRMQGRLVESIEHAKDALSHPKPNIVGASLKLADGYYASGRLALAERVLSDAFDVNPKNQEVQRKRIDALVNLGAIATAKKFAEAQNLPNLSPLIPELIAKQEAFSNVFQVVLAEGLTDAGSEYLTLYSSAERLKSDLDGVEEGDWIVFSGQNLQESYLSKLVDERSLANGILYAADPQLANNQSKPTVDHAWVLGLRAGHLQNVIEDQIDGTVKDVLQAAVNVYSSQYVPIEKPSLAPVLSLESPVHSDHILVCGTDIADEIANSLSGSAGRCDEKNCTKEIVSTNARAIILPYGSIGAVDLNGLSINKIISLDEITREERMTIECIPELKEIWRAALTQAASIIVTNRDVEEWLEDTFRISVYVSDTMQDGVERALAFIKHRFVVKVGAGIGNILQATPLLRWLSEHLDAPVDVCISSGVGAAHELFGESKYVNQAYHADDVFNGRRYDFAFVASTMGAIARGALADNVFIQRSVYDFYSTTKFKSEARYYFNGIENLVGNDAGAHSAPMSPFIREFTDPKEGYDAAKSIVGAKIAISGGKRGDLWGKRQWSHFDSLAQGFMDLGAEVHGVGAPGEAIPGCIDHTEDKLRDSVRFIHSLDAFVGPDGGAFHIADALYVPTVVIFGPTSVVKNGPMIDTASVIRTERSCSPCQFRDEFTTCQTPMCMNDVEFDRVKDEVIAKIENGGTFSQFTTTQAIETEFKNHPVLVRKTFEPQFLQSAFSFYPSALSEVGVKSWEKLFSAVLDQKRFERARQILDWRIATGEMDDTVRYCRARLAYIEKRFDDAIAYCVEDDEAVARPWVLRNIRLRSHIGLQSWDVVAQLWDHWEGSSSADAETDKRAWVDAAIMAIRAYAVLGKDAELSELQQSVTLIANDNKGFSEVLKQIDTTPYRLPSTRFKEEDKIVEEIAETKQSVLPKIAKKNFRLTIPKSIEEDGLDHEVNSTLDAALTQLEETPVDKEPEHSTIKVGIVGTYVDRPVILRKHHPKIEIFVFTEEEMHLEELGDMDLVLHSLDNAKVHDLHKRFDQVGLEKGESGSGLGWMLWARIGLVETGSCYSLSEIYSLVDLPEAEEQPKRIMVVAHHHLEKYNPRGGERSTQAILKKLQADGYETIVAVEHKKTKFAGLDETDLTKYILCGQYVFAKSLSAVIACWQPDGIITYGSAGLIAGKVSAEMDVPYVMFPRDWSEVCPKPHLNLLERPTIQDKNNVYRFVYENASTVITNAKYVGEVLKKIYDADSENSYVPVLPPPEEFFAPPAHERPHILLINAKKFDGGNLLRAVAKARPQLSFRVIGGDGLPFPPNVIVEPFFNGEHYSDMFKDACLFLFPLGDEDPCGTGRVVFESLICKTPAISFDRGGMKEVLPDKWLAKENTIEAWLEKIDQVLAERPTDAEFEDLMAVFDHKKQLEVVDKAVAKLLS